MSHLRKQTWVERVKEVHNFHISRLRDIPNWRVQDTATLLNRSKAAISDDLMLASWLMTHEQTLTKFKNYVDAVKWVRIKKGELRLREIS